MAMAQKSLESVRSALAVMFSPASAPQTAKDASDWLQNFRNDNEQRKRRIKRDAPAEGGCWPIFIALLTIPDASESERLFAAQAMLYRVRRYELADALDIDDPVALSQPPSSSAKPSDEATQRANYEGMETLAGLCVAASGGGVSRPILTHVCLTLVTIALRVATFCPQDQEDTFECVDLVMLVTSAINKAAEEYAASHPGENVQSHVANALLHALGALPEVAAVNQMSIRPRALACAMNDLRSDRAGENLLRTLADLDGLSSGEARLRCCLQWVTHVGLRTSSLLPLLPATASALTIVADQVSNQMMTQGCSAEEALQGADVLTSDGYAACELITSIFESSVERSEALDEVNVTRVTASGRRKARRQRPNNASDVEQQMLEVELARQAASVSTTSAELALPHFIAPLHSALSLAMVGGDDKSKHALVNAVASCASSQLPPLLNRVVHSGGADAETLEVLLSLLQLLLHATNVPSSAGSENNTITSLCLESWLRFHDATMKLNINIQAEWWLKVEEAMYQSMITLMRETRLDAWQGGRGVCDEEDREVFDDWRKESRDWIRGMITCKQPTEAGMLINHSLLRRCLHHIIMVVDAFTNSSSDDASVSNSEDWAGCESALHCTSALGRSITSATGHQANELDPLTVTLLSYMARPSREDSTRLACARHPAVVCSATLTIGALTNWMEKRCVSTRMPGAETAFESCRALCEMSLNFSDRHPIYPIRSHDELHCGASALLKLAGSGPCCLSVAHQQGWLPRLIACYHHIQSYRWSKVFPSQEYPSLNTNGETWGHHLPNGGLENEIPLSASSRRVLLACLLVLASAPGAVGSCGDVEGATRGLSPLFEVMFHSMLTAAAASGLDVDSSEDNLEHDAACVASRGEDAIRSGLAVVVDTLADLEVSVFLSSGQKPCAQVISSAVSTLLASHNGIRAMKSCFRFAAASSLLCDQGNGGSNGDSNRLIWGGRGGHNGANIVVEIDAGVSELSGVSRWLLSRALARCFSERVLDSQEQAYINIPPQGLLELCLAMFRHDVWSDGCALFPIITAVGGGFNSDNIENESFSAAGLNGGNGGGRNDGANLSYSSPPSSPGVTDSSVISSAMAESQVKKWEISNWALTSAAETVFSQQHTYDYSIPLALNGPLLRRGSTFESLFTLALSSIARFNKVISQQQLDEEKLTSLFDSCAWLHILPTILSLLFEETSNSIVLGNENGSRSTSDGSNTSSPGNVPHNHISGLSSEASSLVAKGKSGGVAQRPTCAKQSQCLSLVFPGREAECALKVITSALECCPTKVLQICGGGANLCVAFLRCACGATPSWTLDAITLGFKNLAKAAFASCDEQTRNQAVINAISVLDLQSKSFNNFREEDVKIWGASGQLLCGWLSEAVGDPRFPRYDVSNDAKSQFLAAVATYSAKQDWSGVKNAVKQVCGGKRKTGSGRSLGRPPDYSPWESNFDSRSITAY